MTGPGPPPAGNPSLTTAVIGLGSMGINHVRVYSEIEAV
jgi:hypothetical protein